MRSHCKQLGLPHALYTILRKVRLLQVSSNKNLTYLHTSILDNIVDEVREVDK